MIYSITRPGRLLYESIAGQDILVYTSGVSGANSKSKEWEIKYPARFSKSWKTMWEDFFVSNRNSFFSSSKFVYDDITIFSTPSVDDFGRTNFIAVAVGNSLAELPYRLGNPSSLSTAERNALINIKQKMERGSLAEEDFLPLISVSVVSERVYKMAEEIRGRLTPQEIKVLINFLQEELGSR